MFLTNDTADKDLAMQIAMQNYKKMIERENQHRNAVLCGDYKVISSHCIWDISDRDWFIMIAFVIPKSKKAKNRFSNLMESNAECIIEQHLTDKVFLTSMNGKNHFWVSLNHDKDWDLDL